MKRIGAKIDAIQEYIFKVENIQKIVIDREWLER